MTTYYKNDQITATCTFATVAGTLTNPTTVTFKTENPAGTVTSYTYGTDSEVTRSSTGVYVLTVTLSTAGPWQIAAIGTGAIARSAITNLIAKARPGD